MTEDATLTASIGADEHHAPNDMTEANAQPRRARFDRLRSEDAPHLGAGGLWIVGEIGGDRLIGQQVAVPPDHPLDGMPRYRYGERAGCDLMIADQVDVGAV